MKSIVKKAREIVTQLYERNMVAWNDLDREVVFAIQALIAEVQRMEALKQPEQEPVAWMNNKDFEPIRVRIMQEAYELADRNDSEGYNAIKVMCGDVQRMLPPQRTWVGLTQDELNMIGDSMRTWNSWTITDVYFAIEAKLKEKNR